MPRVAAVDDDPGVLGLIRCVLEGEGIALDGFADAQSFLDRADAASYDLILCDLKLPGWSGLDLLKEIRDRTTRPRVVIITGYATVPTAVTAMKEGASDYLIKPFSVKDLLALVRKSTLEGEAAGPAPAERAVPGVVGRSRVFCDLLEKARRVGALPATVLLLGETGTGKEVVARYIVAHGPRANGPFVVLNCAALPENLVESELFGHVKGAFSGATLPRRGLFEEAQGGTLFLDEVGALPLPAQAKLLRALEEREIRKVGDNRSVAVDVRILAATNLDLEAAVARQAFREDLFYRLSVVTLVLPPLRDRVDDIPLLAEHFLRELAPPGAPPKTLSKEALALLRGCRFPGNVRELRHALAQACAFAAGTELGASDFDALAARRDLRAPEAARDEESAPLTPERIREALEKTRGNRLEAARLLGVSRSTFYRALGKTPDSTA